MDFASSKSEAEAWVKTDNCDFGLIASVESERRLVFAARNCPHVSFFLVCPEQEKQHWVCVLFSGFTLCFQDYYSCGLSTATIEFSCPSACLSITQ